MLKCLVLFDAENQSEEIEQLENWKLGASFNYQGFTIKEEDIDKGDVANFSNVELVIILIAESTKFLSKRFKEYVAHILKLDTSILCLNLNGKIALDVDNCPLFLANAGCIHMPFTNIDLALSLGYIKINTRADNKTGSFHFKNYTPDPMSE